MRKRRLVIGDIHGGLKGLEQVLERAMITQEDHLTFLGDYVDGWSESPGVIDALIDLKSRMPCVFIRGNHDDLFYQWLVNGTANDMWVSHGGASSIQAYSAIGDQKKKRHIEFLENLENYYIDTENRLYVHAGFTNLNGVSHEYFPELLYWDRSLWELVLALNPHLKKEDPHYPDRLKNYLEIFIGHNPTTRMGTTKPMHLANVWNLDTGAAYTGPLTIMDADTKEIWQSDPLHLLYPDEPGRNK